MTRFFPFSRFTVHGNSMLPTLKPGQDVLVFNWVYIFSKPKKGDVVVIKKNDTEIVKRIGQITSDPPARLAAKRVGWAGRNIFVQGDNKKESTDSRKFGAIKKSDILGKVIFVR